MPSPSAQIDRAEVLLQNGERLTAVLQDACRQAHTPRMALDAVCSVARAVERLLQEEMLSPELGQPMSRRLDELLRIPPAAQSLDEAGEITCERLRRLGVQLSDLIV